MAPDAGSHTADETPVTPEVALGLAFFGSATDPNRWSGTQIGLARGLRACAVTVRHIDVSPPRLVERAALRLLAIARAGGVGRSAPQLAPLRSAVALARMRRVEPLDALIQLGTTYTLPASVPTVVYFDMTLAQALECGHPLVRDISPRARDSWLARQRRVYEQACVCCAFSAWAAESVVREYGIARAKVRVVGAGRNLVLQPRDRDWTVPTFLFLARDWEQKNGARVVRAFKRLRTHVAGARLHLVGDHPPIIEENVITHGRLSVFKPDEAKRLADLFQVATCFVMPSLCEAFGIAYAEAGAAGLPSIGTSVGGAADVVREGTGRLIDPTDDDELLGAMHELSEPHIAAAAGAKALQYAEQFTWERVARRILRALEATAPARNGRPRFTS